MKILLISYSFPPYPGIGGRRWAKLVKYLTKIGHEIYVIHASFKNKEKSLWTDDICHNPNIISVPINSYYPQILNKIPSTLLQKVHYTFSLYLLKFTSKGSPYDKGWRWNKKMFKKAKDLIDSYNIKNIFVSTAPFSNGYYTVQLKNYNPNLNIIIDIRDPWTWGIGYGFSDLSDSRLKFEMMMEYETISRASKVLVPVNIMKEKLSILYKNYEYKIELLPHAFDKDDIVKKNITNEKIFKIIFFGSLYKDIGDYIENFSKAIKKSGVNYRLEIYSEGTRYSEIFEKYGLLNKNVFYKNKIKTKSLFEKISNCNFVLIIHPDYGVNNLSTKFYEVIQSRTPIIYLSKNGYTSRFVVKNKIGYFLPLHKIEEELKKILLNKLPYQYNTNFITNDYSFEFQADNISNNMLKT